MLVKFIKSDDGHLLKEGTRGRADLIAGEIYPVLEIHKKKEEVTFRICPPKNNTTLKFYERKGRVIYSFDQTSFYIKAEQFEIINNSIPNDWGVEIISESLFLGPKKWMANGFWEAYFGDEEWAQELFVQEVLKIKEFHQSI